MNKNFLESKRLYLKLFFLVSLTISCLGVAFVNYKKEYSDGCVLYERAYSPFETVEFCFLKIDANTSIRRLQGLLTKSVGKSDKVSLHFVSQIKKYLKKYQEHEKKRVTFIEKYRKLKRAKKYFEANNILDKIDTHTPIERTQERKMFLEIEQKEIDVILKDTLKQQNQYKQDLESLKSKMYQTYRSKSYFSVSQSIQEILEYQVSSEPSYEVFRKKLKNLKEVATHLQGKIIEAQYKQYQEKEKIFRTIQYYHTSLKRTLKQGSKSKFSLGTLAQKYIRENYDDFITYFSSRIKNVTIDPQNPVLSLYFMEQLKEKLQPFLEWCLLKKEQKLLGNQFVLEIEKMYQKIDKKIKNSSLIYQKELELLKQHFLSLK